MRVLVLLVVALALASAADAKQLYNRKRAPATWAVGAPAQPFAQVKFMVGLKQQNLDVLDQKFWAVSTPGSAEYRNFLSIEEIQNIVRPKQEHIDAVRTWLESYGVQEIKDFVDVFEVTADVKTVQALFATRMNEFTHISGKKIIRQFGSHSIPDEVAEAITIVTGLTEFPIPRPNPRKSKGLASNEPAVAYSIVPQTVFASYGTPSSNSYNSANSQGVIEFEEQNFNANNLQQFAQQMGISITPVPANHIIGSNDPNEPGTEAELDIQWVAGVGLNVDNWFWLEDGTAWLYTFATHFFNTTNVPLVASISYGWSEQDQCEEGIGAEECAQLGVDSNGFVAAVNTQFQKIGARGVSLFSASGDSGANGRTDPLCFDATLHPDFPGSSPFVTSVGATQLNNPYFNLTTKPPVCSRTSCAAGGTEVAVTYNAAGFASGGGFSFVASTPSYQSSAVSQYLSSGVSLPPSSYYNTNGRGYPDIAAFGTEILIYEGGIEAVGGTSASSPIVAGVTALLNAAALQKTGKPLGFLNPLLYQIASTNPECFTDITVGDNLCTEYGCSSSCKGFKCTKGWDPVTGLGSPKYPCLLKYIQTHL